MRIISLDTETSGVDHFHGAAPFLITTCDEQGQQQWWQWLVDPLTRRVDYDVSDVEAIQAVIDDADEVVLHNAKFDAHALDSVGIHLPFDKVWDTLIVSHLLASNHRHNLTDTVIEYLGVDIEPYELRVREATVACRQAVKRNQWAACGVDTSRWRLAEEDAEGMPSVGGSSERDEEKPWKNDMWLAESVADALMVQGVDPEDAGVPSSWRTAVQEYANADTAATLSLWLWAKGEIQKRGLWKIFLDRMKLVRIAYDLERHGVTMSHGETNRLVEEYSTEVDLAQAECLAVADQFDFPLEMPAGAAPNDSLREFVWGSTRLECPRCGNERKHKKWVDGVLNGQVVCPKCAGRKGRKTKRGLVGGPVKIECVVKDNPCLALPYVYGKGGNPTLDRDALEHYVATLEPGPALDFMTNLVGMRSQQTAVTYMRGYERYWIPTSADSRRLHPSFNITGTDTLRWSSNNPNIQNVSKKEDFNLRRCFGPVPGREWWSMDFKSIERRIPVYECGEPKMLEVFEKPNEPPYWGNLYCLTASVLYPDEYWPTADTEGKFRKDYPQLYKRAKFFDLAKQYGCGRKKGDALSRVTGSFDKMNDQFPLFAALQRHYLDFARRHGYVETIPDKNVDPERGYPILASRTEDGSVSGTTPFNYHVSGTAMQCTNRAMIETEERVRQWNAEGWDGFLTLQVHDELVWDCPCGTGSEPWQHNLWRMDELKAIMESVGDGIGMPTPVSREYHARSYAEGVTV